MEDTKILNKIRKLKRLKDSENLILIKDRSRKNIVLAISIGLFLLVISLQESARILNYLLPMNNIFKIVYTWEMLLLASVIKYGITFLIITFSCITISYIISQKQIEKSKEIIKKIKEIK